MATNNELPELLGCILFRGILLIILLPFYISRVLLKMPLIIKLIASSFIKILLVIKKAPIIVKKAMMFLVMSINKILITVAFVFIETRYHLKKHWIRVSPYFWSLVCWGVSGAMIYKCGSKYYSQIYSDKKIHKNLIR